ncbi:MAG: F0F1 ATP synthase subunit B, partial [Roseomonas sp.]|nr:F0F1 ATP synthase subunit B [Roseomonas sp.]
RAAALAEAEDLIARARAEAERLAQAAAVEAETAAKRRERMAMDRIAAAEAGAVTEVRNAAAEIAIIAAREVLAQTVDAQADAALIDAAVADLPRALKAA